MACKIKIYTYTYVKAGIESKPYNSTPGSQNADAVCTPIRRKPKVSQRHPLNFTAFRSYLLFF